MIFIIIAVRYPLQSRYYRTPLSLCLLSPSPPSLPSARAHLCFHLFFASQPRSRSNSLTSRYLLSLINFPLRLAFPFSSCLHPVHRREGDLSMKKERTNYQRELGWVTRKPAPQISSDFSVALIVNVIFIALFANIVRYVSPCWFMNLGLGLRIITSVSQIFSSRHFPFHSFAIYSNKDLQRWKCFKWKRLF